MVAVSRSYKPGHHVGTREGEETAFYQMTMRIKKFHLSHGKGFCVTMTRPSHHPRTQMLYGLTLFLFVCLGWMVIRERTQLQLSPSCYQFSSENVGNVAHVCWKAN